MCTEYAIAKGVIFGREMYKVYVLFQNFVQEQRNITRASLPVWFCYILK